MILDQQTISWTKLIIVSNFKLLIFFISHLIDKSIIISSAAINERLIEKYALLCSEYHIKYWPLSTLVNLCLS
jgi:hypothetical protein